MGIRIEIAIDRSALIRTHQPSIGWRASVSDGLRSQIFTCNSIIPLNTLATREYNIAFFFFFLNGGTVFLVLQLLFEDFACSGIPGAPIPCLVLMCSDMWPHLGNMCPVSLTSLQGIWCFTSGLLIQVCILTISFLSSSDIDELSISSKRRKGNKKT